MIIDDCLTCCVCLKVVWAQLISESKLLLVMGHAQPLRFWKSSQQPLARSSQRREPRQCSRNRAFTQFKSNSGGARPRKLNLLRKEKQTPTFTLFPPLVAQKVAARKTNSSQIQARATPRVAKTSTQAAQIEGKRSQPLAQKPGVAQKRKAPPLTPAARQFRKVFDGSVSETQHLEYHSGSEGFCIRCDVQKRRKVYEEACALHLVGNRRAQWPLGPRVYGVCQFTSLWQAAA